ncbi:MAG: hypothetical protein PHT51_00420 [Patescibacteria group bacterium]|nr:hypothetical protein [Patescibacteria group bacterium]MDD4611041.1 hypothetical protein [Patescibacteria group bacterium]
MKISKTQIIYKLNGINADDGVDVFEIAPVLMHFGELIRSANNILGFEQKIDVKVKPFREGSWITDFVIQHSQVPHLLNYLKDDDGQSLMLLLSFLGLNAKEGVTGLIKIIQFTRGIVSNFERKDNGETITYISPTGEKLEVSMAEHKLVQSPLVQNNYYNCTVAPFSKFPATTEVSFKITAKDSTEQIIKKEDIEFIEKYAHTELSEETEDNISILKNIYLKPKRGSYSGEEKAYSFIMGDNNVLWPVTIDDEVFLKKLHSGEIRLYAEDVLKVDLEIKQKKDSNNKIASSYSIKLVTEYMPFEKPKQMEF